MYCNACGAEFRGRYCHQCGRANPGAAASGRRAPLERPWQGRKIAGVCLALANSLDVDVNLVRVLWVVITVLFAVVFGVVAYLVAWILIPEEPQLVLQAPETAPGPR
ncbi:MAG TPA: PspC domain-containing protein [Terriglobales bacterium]|nr:PspC domain-containing protein [Terriglobales bacterium]